MTLTSGRSLEFTVAFLPGISRPRAGEGPVQVTRLLKVAMTRAIGEFRDRQELFYRQGPEALKGLLEVARVESTESSTRLEGINVPANRIRRLVVHQAQPRNRSEQEVAGYRDALTMIHESGLALPFMPNVMPMAVEQLATTYAQAAQMPRVDSLVVVPLAILDFLCIHPFADGNGRMARLLTLLLLYHFGYEVGRYISIERVYEQTKEGYYETLEASSQGWHEGRHDPNPWLNYFWGVMLRGYREFEERVAEVRDRKGSKSGRVREAVMARQAPFSISEIEADCPGVSRETVRLALRGLSREGLIASTGNGRSAKWVRKA